MSETMYRLLGKEWVSPLGFQWRWNKRFGVYVCDTPDCHAREADAHTDECCAVARARSEAAA